MNVTAFVLRPQLRERMFGDALYMACLGDVLDLVNIPSCLSRSDLRERERVREC